MAIVGGQGPLSGALGFSVNVCAGLSLSKAVLVTLDIAQRRLAVVALAIFQDD